MLEIDRDIYIMPEAVTLVKSAGKGKSVLFVTGQSALDGFVLDRDAAEVASDISEELGVDLHTVFEDQAEPEPDKQDEE